VFLQDLKFKTARMTCYLEHVCCRFKTNAAVNKRLDSLRREFASEEDDLNDRVNYYLKKDVEFELENPQVWSSFRHRGNTAYQIDLWEILRHFDPDYRFDYKFGDLTTVPHQCSFVKSRPIECDNANSALLKLNAMRHFLFLSDPISFESKKNQIVWRGRADNNKLRIQLLDRYRDHPLCDIANVSKKAPERFVVAPLMKISKHLDYKYILSLEGRDVATNTKWIMSSNSLCLMPKPKYETWFMEGRLKAGFHYVELNSELSDLEEKINYYNEHPQEAKKISYVEQFLNPRRELLLGVLVAEKYDHLRKSNQI
jgi:hypothetical protein